jgi:PadR family transcriptional regulator PadR
MQKILYSLKLNAGGFLEFIVLKMISEHAHSPNEIFMELKDIGFKTPMGSLYPLLRAFRQKDLVIRGYEEMDDGGASRTYGLTDRGRQRLAELRSDWKRLNSLIASLGKTRQIRA